MLPGLRGIIGFPVASDSRSLTATGTTSFVVPKYHTLTVDVYGAGGGADNGGDGGASSFGSSTPVVGDGGKSGWYGVIVFVPFGGGYIPVYGGRAGANGTASGGDTNTTGGGSPGGSGSGPGGAGGRATKAFTYGTSGAPVPGTTITVTVGAKGGNGTDGKVLINWI